MRHKLSFVALEDMLLLVNSLFQQDLLPSTKHSFLNYFPVSTLLNTIFTVQKKCGNTLITCQDRSIKRTVNCDVCNFENTIQSSSENFFVTLPLEQELKEVIQQNAEDFTNNKPVVRDNILTDIKDGKFYKKILQNKNKERKKITLVMNTDGVQVFKSKNKGLWPIQVFINELDVTKRFSIKNILVLGLFYEFIAKCNLC